MSKAAKIATLGVLTLLSYIFVPAYFIGLQWLGIALIFPLVLLGIILLWLFFYHIAEDFLSD